MESEKPKKSYREPWLVRKSYDKAPLNAIFGISVSLPSRADMPVDDERTTYLSPVAKSRAKHVFFDGDIDVYPECTVSRMEEYASGSYRLPVKIYNFDTIFGVEYFGLFGADVQQVPCGLLDLHLRVVTTEQERNEMELTGEPFFYVGPSHLCDTVRSYRNNEVLLSGGYTAKRLPFDPLGPNCLWYLTFTPKRRKAVETHDRTMHRKLMHGLRERASEIKALDGNLLNLDKDNLVYVPHPSLTEMYRNQADFGGKANAIAVAGDVIQSIAQFRLRRSYGYESSYVVGKSDRAFLASISVCEVNLLFRCGQLTWVSERIKKLPYAARHVGTAIHALKNGYEGITKPVLDRIRYHMTRCACPTQTYLNRQVASRLKASGERTLYQFRNEATTVMKEVRANGFDPMVLFNEKVRRKKDE